MQTIEQALEKLSHSKFRCSFHLDSDDKDYIDKKGLDTIALHAADFIDKKLTPAYPAGDGRQTPWRGHPVFKAQHACACCCRGCLEKWYHVPKGRELTPDEQSRIVNLLMAWIKREYQQYLL